MVMRGFKCAPETAPNVNINRVKKRKLLIAPVTGPMKAALSNTPQRGVGSSGAIAGEMPTKMVAQVKSMVATDQSESCDSLTPIN